MVLACCGADAEPEPTSHAGDCGQALGIEVYVDGTSSLDLGPMSCAHALSAVVAARDAGAAAGFWGAEQEWPGFRLQFINAPDLAAQGSPELDGLTEGNTITVSYEQDVWAPRPIPAWTPSTVILVHELTHATYGEDNHCNWSARYAPSYVWEFSWASGFHDDCQDATCRGDECN